LLFINNKGIKNNFILQNNINNFNLI